jgi:hypothetical protein
MRDLLLYIRADESKHREVNHTLGNLNQREDPNPYVSVYYKDAVDVDVKGGEGDGNGTMKKKKERPGKGLEVQRPMGWERDEVL